MQQEGDTCEQRSAGSGGMSHESNWVTCLMWGRQAPCVQPSSMEGAAGAARAGAQEVRARWMRRLAACGPNAWSCRALRRWSDRLVDTSSVQLVLSV